MGQIEADGLAMATAEDNGQKQDAVYKAVKALQLVVRKRQMTTDDLNELEASLTLLNKMNGKLTSKLGLKYNVDDGEPASEVAWFSDRTTGDLEVV